MRTRHTTLITFLLTFAGAAHAQDASDPSTQPPGAAGGAIITDESGRPTTFRLDLRGLHYFSTDLDEEDTDSGDVSVSRFGPIASVEFPVGDASSITLAAEFTYSFYDFDGTGIFEDDNELLDDAYELGLTATFASRISDHWSYFIGAGGRLSMESGADASDALTGRIIGGLNYTISEGFFVGAGVGVSTQLDDDILVVPFLTARYQFNDRWSLGAGGGPAAAGRTVGATLNWQAQPDLGVSLTGAWDRREFRLDDDGPVPEGIATDSRVDIILAVNWGIADSVTLRLEGGASVWQEFEFEDEDNDTVADPDGDPTVFVGASIGFTF